MKSTVPLLITLITLVLGDPLVVPTEYGPIRGSYGADGNVRQFFGIPFANPPLGSLRFMPPEKFSQPWGNSTRDATKPAADCLQKTGSLATLPMSEDCLYLNVWTANNGKSSTSEPLPVMVFLYGGSWEHGSSTFLLYNGYNLITNGDRDVVVVTLNYRLGAFGYLGSSQLQSMTPDGSTGNAGIQDQRMALEWVQNNIANFGGDPNRVLLFGESAGAGSTSSHLLMKKSKGLFHRALMESGPIAPWTAKNMTVAQDQFNEVAKSVQCDITLPADKLVQCLQQVNASEYIKVPSQQPGSLTDWSPCIDGVELDDVPRKLAEKGDFGSDVPVMLGTNLNEGTLFVRGMNNGKKATEADYQEWLKMRSWGNETLYNLLKAQYPSSKYASPWAAASFVVTDCEMVCPARRTARYLKAAHPNTPVYLYHFTHEILAIAIFDPTLGVFHASELIFVWDIHQVDVLGIKIPLPLTKDEKNLQQVFVNYWTNFAADGNPNGNNTTSKLTTSIHWPEYTAETDQNIELDVALSLNTHLNQKNCDFWDINDIRG